MLLIQQILETSRGSKMHWLKLKDQYGKDLRCPNISGKYHIIYGVCHVKKGVFGHKRTVKAQISLHIHAGPSLSTNIGVQNTTDYRYLSEIL